MLPALLIAAAAAAAAKGVKDGIDGKEMREEAERLARKAERRYENEKEETEQFIANTHKKLESYGELGLSIGKLFGEFRGLADILLEKLEKSPAFQGKKLEVPIEEYKIKDIESVEISAQEFLAVTTGSVAAGAAAAYAVYGGVMALATASTGTAIATLSGVAASNAALAAIGGGSLAAGGLGVAGGTAILGGIVAAPVIAIAGWAYKSKAKESLETAEDYEDEVNKIIKKYHKIVGKHREIQVYIDSVHEQLERLNVKLLSYVATLKRAVNMTEQELNRGSEDLFRDIENGYMLMSIMADIITTPLFKMEEDTENEKNQEKLVLKLDEEGCWIPNKYKMQGALEAAKKV